MNKHAAFACTYVPKVRAARRKHMKTETHNSNHIDTVCLLLFFSVITFNFFPVVLGWMKTRVIRHCAIEWKTNFMPCVEYIKAMQIISIWSNSGRATLSRFRVSMWERVFPRPSVAVLNGIPTILYAQTAYDKQMKYHFVECNWKTSFHHRCPCAKDSVI